MMINRKPRVAGELARPFSCRTASKLAGYTGEFSLAVRFKKHSRRGFTLIECLATMLLIGIILPAVDQGLSAATRAASDTRRRTEAAGLAQSKLSELIVSGPAVWQQGQMQGNFSGDMAGYTWKAQLQQWPVNSSQSASAQNITMQELDVTVSWVARNQPVSITVSSLVYQRPIPTATTS